MELRTGTIIGQWTLIAKLGTGIDGQVWSVTDQHHQRAMKICAQSTNFFREYDLLRSVNIAGVIPVYEYGLHEEWGYYIMDLAEGLPFEEHLQRLPKREQYEECIHLLVSITQILVQLHQRSLMHLDIKSDNLLVSAEGKITLIDFGKVGLVEDYSTHRKGSMQTMSPEQRSHWYLTPKSDVYSLAVTTYQALSGSTAPFANVGQVWPLLMNKNSDIEQRFAGFLQRCLHIVPSKRPTMQSFHEMVCGIQTNTYRAKYFPMSEQYIGTCPTLSENCVLIGPIGSGRRRILHENIRLAYLDGTPTFMSKAKPLMPFSLWIDILHDLFQQFSPEQRHQISSGIEVELAFLLPHLFTNVSAPSVIDTKTLGRAINVVFSRCGSLVIITEHLDIADIGSRQIAAYLWTHPLPDVHLWGTSLTPVDWANCLEPPHWSTENDLALMRALLPTYCAMPKTNPGKTPLHSAIKAWHLNAQHKDQPAMVAGVSTKDLLLFGLLPHPFPKKIASVLHHNLQELLSQQVLEYTDAKQTHVQFTFLPFRWMIQQSIIIRQQYHAVHMQLVSAWEDVGDSQEQLHHLYLSDNLAPTHLAQALWLALIQLNTTEIKRWFRLCTLQGIRPNNTAYQIGLLLLLSPSDSSYKTTLRALQQKNLRAPEQFFVDYLVIQTALFDQDYDFALQRAEHFVHIPNPPLPTVQFHTYVMLGELYLHNQDWSTCIQVCEHALSLPNATTIRFVSIEILQILADAYRLSGQLQMALQVCTQAIQLPQKETTASLKAYQSLGWVYYELGKRNHARKAWRKIKQLSSLSTAPLIKIQNQMALVRLSLESGQARYQTHHIKAHLLQPLANTQLQAAVQAACWELSIQTASSRWIKRGFEISPTALGDRGKIALARWYWLIGDIKAGLELLHTDNTDYDAYALRVESIRFGILLGHFDSLKSSIEPLAQQLQTLGFVDLHLLLNLCIETIYFQEDALLLSGDLTHPWTEISLGGLHLQAIRKRLRGETIYDTLNTLQYRAKVLDHQLYLALSNHDLYI